MSAAKVLLCLFLTGCASIQSQLENGHPNRKEIVYVADGETRTLLVRRSEGLFFNNPGVGDGKYWLSFDSRLNPWTIGNLAIGGFPGFVVDLATGAIRDPYLISVKTQPILEGK